MPGSSRRQVQDWHDDPSPTWARRQRVRQMTESVTASFEARPCRTEASHEDRSAGVRTIVATAERCILDAREAEAEYRRALDDFERLMSHRIANPLQVIVGMVDTLLLMPDLEAPRRIAFLAAISEQAHVLREVSTAPRIRSHVEAELRPDVDCQVVRRFERTAARLAQAARPASG